MPKPSLPAAAGRRLSAAALEDAQDALSDNTKRAYRSALRRLDDWLAGREATDARLAEYLRSLRAAGRGAASASMALAAARYAAGLSGRDAPIGPECRLALAAHRRDLLARPRGQVDGVRWEQADAAAAIAAGSGAPAGLRDAAIVAVASDCLLRVGELAALRVRDVAAEGDGSGRVTVRQSKTDQTAIGAVLYAGPPTMRRISSWLDAAGIAGVPDSPLFRQLRRGGRVQSGGLSRQALRKIIAERAKAAGIEGRVSGHSLRVGSAQSLAAAGAELVELQTAGRWQSPSMPAHYSRAQRAGRGAVARLRHQAG